MNEESLRVANLRIQLAFNGASSGPEVVHWELFCALIIGRLLPLVRFTGLPTCFLVIRKLESSVRTVSW